MKKLLSISALALVLASSVSIGASAETAEATSKTKLLIQIVANQYDNGQNQTGLLSGTKKDTVVDTIASNDFITNVDNQYGKKYITVDKALTKYENNKTETVAEVLAKVTKDEASFNKFKNNFATVLSKLQAMDSKKGSDRATTETNFRNIVKAYNPKLNVVFGRNGKGETTADIKNAGKLIVELNSEDIQTIIDKVNSTDWNALQDIKASMK